MRPTNGAVQTSVVLRASVCVGSGGGVLGGGSSGDGGGSTGGAGGGGLGTYGWSTPRGGGTPGGLEALVGGVA